MSTMPSEAGPKPNSFRQSVGRMQRFLHPVHDRFDGNQAPPGIRLANAIIGFMGS